MAEEKPENPSAEKSTFAYRVRGAIVLIGVVALLGLAVWLDPVRLERYDRPYPLLPPCGFLMTYGYPCPTCFMTRAFVYMMHGRPDKSVLAQPFGALLCLIVIYLGVGAVHVLITGRPWRPFWNRWPRRYLLGTLSGCFLGAWIFRLAYGIITHEFPLIR